MTNGPRWIMTYMQLMSTAGAISGQQDDAITPVAHFDTDCRAHSSPAS